MAERERRNAEPSAAGVVDGIAGHEDKKERASRCCWRCSLPFAVSRSALCVTRFYRIALPALMRALPVARRAFLTTGFAASFASSATRTAVFLTFAATFAVVFFAALIFGAAA